MLKVPNYSIDIIGLTYIADKILSTKDKKTSD